MKGENDEDFEWQVKSFVFTCPEIKIGFDVEAPTGVEPVYAVLQTAA